jgi:hypothetical protein
MGSIGARIQREREQREQYEQWRHTTDPGRNWTVTACECFFYQFQLWPETRIYI